jgi:hypothetical protein
MRTTTAHKTTMLHDGLQHIKQTEVAHNPTSMYSIQEETWDKNLE